MREVFLTPEHSSWWLISPGVTLFYDKVVMLESDYDRVCREADYSSYHHSLAVHLDVFVHNDDYPEIQIVNDYPCQNDDFLEAEKLRDQLLDSALSPEDPCIDASELIALTANSFRHWINYNRNKMRFLRGDEPFKKLLIDEKIPQWECRLNAFDRLLKLPAEDQYDAFVGNDDCISSFTRLVASSLNCIRMARSGKQVYDPLLVQYMPMIQLIEGRSVSNSVMECSVDHGVISMFEAYRIRLSNYGEIVPVNLSLLDLKRTIEDFNRVRVALDNLDRCIKSIRNSDLSDSLAEIKREIASLRLLADNACRKTSYCIWLAGLIWTLTAFFPSKMFEKIGNATAAIALAESHVGRFAGAFSVIAERLILQQDTALARRSPVSMDYKYFSNHYLNYTAKRCSTCG